MADPVTCLRLSRPNRALLQRIEHAARIACIAAEWTQVEENLARLIGGVFGTSEPTENGGFSISTNFFAQTTILTIETIRQRLKIIDETFGALAKGTDFGERWATLKQRLEQRAKERNKVTHGNWALSEDFPEDLILEERGGGTFRYTTKHLDDILARVVEARTECHILLIDVLTALDQGRLAGTSMQRLSSN